MLLLFEYEYELPLQNDDSDVITFVHIRQVRSFGQKNLNSTCQQIIFSHAHAS